MPEFVNPFSGVVPREMTRSELVRAIMLDLAAELEAVHLYLAHMDAAGDEDAKKVLYDIALEELVHAGEFTSLLYRLDPVTGQKAQEGFGEVKDLLASKAPYEVEGSDGAQGGGKTEPAPESSEVAAEEPPAQRFTVGSLIGTEPR